MFNIPSLFNRPLLFKFGAFLSSIAAIYHFIGIFYPISSAPPYRHALFVLVNLFCTYGFLKRPKLFVVFFSFLFVQQLYSHGGSLIQEWTASGSIDKIDLLVVILIPVFFINLLLEWKVNFKKREKK